VLGSNLGWNIGYPESDTLCFYSNQAIPDIRPQSDYDGYPPDSFEFIIRQSSYHLTPYGPATGNGKLTRLVMG
jgi:hypothetical protein